MSTFKTLPPELRIPIYTEVLQSESPVNAWYALLLTCRTVHDEVILLLSTHGHLHVRIPSTTTLVAARYVENAQNKDESPSPDALAATLAYFNRFAAVTISMGMGSFQRANPNMSQARSALRTFGHKVLTPRLQATSPYPDATIPSVAIDYHCEPWCCWDVEEFHEMWSAEGRMLDGHPLLLWFNAYWANHGKIFEELRQLRHHVPTYQKLMRLGLAVLCFEAVRRRRDVWQGVERTYCEHTDQWLCVGPWDIS